MTNPTIALTEYLDKLGVAQDKDFLQESMRLMSQMLMELEVEEEAWAAQHERTPRGEPTGMVIGSAAGRRE